MPIVALHDFLKGEFVCKSDNSANHGFSLTFFKVNLFAKATLRIEIMATATILNSYRFDPLLLTYKMEGEFAGFACPPLSHFDNLGQFCSLLFFSKYLSHLLGHLCHSRGYSSHFEVNKQEPIESLKPAE